jgi:hypothetical protein
MELEKENQVTATVICLVTGDSDSEKVRVLFYTEKIKITDH